MKGEQAYVHYPMPPIDHTLHPCIFQSKKLMRTHGYTEVGPFSGAVPKYVINRLANKSKGKRIDRSKSYLDNMWNNTWIRVISLHCICLARQHDAISKDGYGLR